MNFSVSVKVAMIAMVITLHGCGGSGGEITGEPADEFPGESTAETPEENTDAPTTSEPSDSLPVALAAESADVVIRNSLLDYYTSNNNSGAIQIGIAVQVDAVPESAADAGANTGNRTFSDTNVQEQGVDESDRIKIDGDVLFALEKPESDFYRPGDIVVSPTESSDSFLVTPLPLNVETLSAYKLDGDNSSVLSRFSLDGLADRNVSGMYLHTNGGNKDLVLLTGPSFSPWESWGTTDVWSFGETRLNWVDASNPANMSIKRTMDIQGHMISSRRVGDRLILVTRHTPYIDGLIAYPFTEADFTQNRDVITNADVSQLLPTLTISENGQSTTRPLINSDNLCYSSQPEVNDQVSEEVNGIDTSFLYPSPNIIAIVSIDLNSFNSSVNSTCFVGDTETLYVSPQSIYLATTQYDYGISDFESVTTTVNVDLPPEVRPIEYYPPEITTDIHKFSFSGSGAPQFKGSGSVKGHLGWNPNRKPYRMSEKDGNLRVVTFDESRSGSPVTLNILRESNGALGNVSTLPNDSRPEQIGKTGESLYASRFIGDKAYLVTFRVTDPLYVLDLSNPNDPRVEGELEIPGYSDYLHAVNDSLLIGLGKDAVPATNVWGDGRGAWFTGVKLALYDVADPTNPFVADERIIGKRYTESPALSQPHSFAYLAGADDRNARFAFPVQLHDQPNTLAPPNGSDWTSNNLLKMEVDTSSRRFVDIPRWQFESRDSIGSNWSPVGLGNDRAVIGSEGDLYFIHNGTLHFGQWDSSEPTSSFSE